jgi:hypothetical protein
MVEQQGQGPRYKVHYSAAIVERLEQLQHRAARQGRGEQSLTAIKHIVRQLEEDPTEFGEPLYRLTSLKLQIRTCSVRPLVVDFAVHQELPLVFLKGIWLLPE